MTIDADTSRFLVDGVGCWAQHFGAGDFSGRPVLFLDRDGVVVEEVHFLRRVEDVRLADGMGPAIAAANVAGVPVVIVTNQSGVARGILGWDEFAAVQVEIVRQLAAAGASLAAVYACGYHSGGIGALDEEAHPWRKPAPGMLLAARDRLGTDLGRSMIVGDRISDLEAGLNAGLRGGSLVLTGYGAEHRPAVEARLADWTRAGFRAAVHEQPAGAIFAALEVLRTPA
jgi:D-glycero-D-manno-heptose 1,7-bisphosphate phosphatase